MRSRLRIRSVGAVTIIALAAAGLGCNTDDLPLIGKVNCDELSSSNWKAMRGEDRIEESEALRRCGTLRGMTRAEVEDWMGHPIGRLGNQSYWPVDPLPEDSMLSEEPQMAVQFEDGETQRIILWGE